MQQRLHTLQQCRAPAARPPCARGWRPVLGGRTQHPWLHSSHRRGDSPPCLGENQSRSSADVYTEAVGMSHFPASSEQPLQRCHGSVRGCSGHGLGSHTDVTARCAPLPGEGGGTLAWNALQSHPFAGAGGVGAAHSAGVKR